MISGTKHQSAKLLSTQPQKEDTSKMATGAYLTGENGQFHHASRLTWVTCLLTLHLCTAYTHATAAPTQYWPACGSTLLCGHRAAVVHSEQITEKALKATQNASQIDIAEKLKDFARESYDRFAHSWAAERDTTNLTSTQPCQVIDTQRTITKSSVAKLNPEPRRPADAGALFHVEEQDEQTFREAVYKTLPRVGQPRPTTGYVSLKQNLAANKDVPPLSSKRFNLLLASSAAYQHQQVTGVPLQASLVNSQDWRKQIRVSAIAKDFGVQRTEDGIAADLMLKCNKLVPGVVISIPKDKVRTYKASGTEAYQLEPQFNPDLVPQLLATFSLPDSPLNQYEVLCSDGTGKVRTGAPTFTVVAPYYDTRDRKQSLPMRVDTLMTGDHVNPNPKSHLWAGKCMEDWSRTIYTHLVQMHMAKGKCNSTSSDALHALQHATPQDMCNTACLIMDGTLTLNANPRLKSCSSVNHLLTCQRTKCDRPAIQLYNCMTVYYVIPSDISNAVTYVGLTELAAMDTAITHPTLQILEMHSTAPHSANGHFHYHTFSAAAATKLRTCKYVEIKVPGEFHIRLTPATGTANSDPTWQHAVVSDSLPRAKDHAQPEMLLQHFTLLCGTAKKYGKILRRPEDPQLYFYDSKGHVRTADEININNVNSIMFTPAGESYLGITSGNRQQKLSSKAGLCIVFKPAEPLTAALVVFVSISKEMRDTVGGTTLLYTTHGSSQWGRMVMKSNSAAPKHVWLSVVKITSEQPISAQEMAILNAKQLKNQSSAAAEGIKGMPAQSRPQNVDFTAQAESPDIFDAILAAGAEPAWPSSEGLADDEEERLHKKRNIQEVSTVKAMVTKLYSSKLSCSAHEFINICNAANVSNEKKPPSMVSAESISRCRQQTVTLPKSWSKPWQELNTTSYMLQPTQTRTSTCHQLPQTSSRAGKPCSTGIHANEHQTPHSMSNMHTAKDNQSKVYDASMLVADKLTIYIDIRQCTSVTSTHTSVNSYLSAPGWSLDAVKWHSTQMAVAVSHLYTSFENIILPMLPSLKPDFVWIIADDLYIVHNGLLPSMEVPIPGNSAYTHYVWQDTHGQGCAAASPLVQVDKSLGVAGNTQRSLSAWDMQQMARSKTLSTLCEISTALIGLLIPVAVTSVIKLFLAVPDSFLWLLHYTQNMKCKTRLWLRRCSFCIVDLVERGDQAVQQTHGAANLSLICCAYTTTHENQHCFDDSIYCIYITVLGYMVQIVLAYLTQWLTSSSMTIAHMWFTKQFQFDHPRCAKGKYWSRIRYRHRKADQKRHCKLLTSLLGIARYVRSISVGSIDMLLVPVYIWKAKTRQSAESASNEEPEQDSCPIGGTHGGEDWRGHLHAEPIHSNTGLYMEKQLRKFCQIHALNALFGKNAIQPADILNFCKNHANTDTGLGAALKGGGIWCPHEGNFADVVINAFLHYHSTPTVRLSSVADKIPVGSAPERFLSGLPADQNAFMLSWHQGTESHQGRGYGHAVCIRKHPETQQWYLLDSERSCPVLLTNHEWRSLKGSVQILAKGSAYSHNSICGATDEGYTQVIDILEYTTPDKICITAQSTVGWRERQQGQVARKQCIDLVGVQDQWGKENLPEHDPNKSQPHEPVSIRPSLLRSALDKVSRPEPAEDKPKLCKPAEGRPAHGSLRRIACGKRLFRMEIK